MVLTKSGQKILKAKTGEIFLEPPPENVTIKLNGAGFIFFSLIRKQEGKCKLNWNIQI